MSFSHNDKVSRNSEIYSIHLELKRLSRALKKRKRSETCMPIIISSVDKLKTR